MFIIHSISCPWYAFSLISSKWFVDLVWHHQSGMCISFTPSYYYANRSRRNVWLKQYLYTIIVGSGFVSVLL
jgi:hypothetical protein